MNEQERINEQIEKDGLHWLATFVVMAAVLPILGIAAAVFTQDPRWLWSLTIWIILIMAGC